MNSSELSKFFSEPTLNPPNFPEVLNDNLFLSSPSQDLSQLSAPLAKSITSLGEKPNDFPLTLYQNPYPSPLDAVLLLSVTANALTHLSTLYNTIFPPFLAPTNI